MQLHRIGNENDRLVGCCAAGRVTTMAVDVGCDVRSDVSRVGDGRESLARQWRATKVERATDDRC